MRKSDDRILVTHVGSLPRNPALRDLLVTQDRGQPIDEGELERQAEAAVRAVVARQLEVGVDVGNDGEQPRAGFSTYVARRMRGFGGESKRRLARDLAEFPDWAAMLQLRRRASARSANAPQALAEIRYDDLSEAERECDLFLRAADTAPRQFAERFMTAASPGTIATIL
ncbi:MAG: cobalamin-independent methionine synthase II family protein, partial [Candidatus Rokuibacteriota bacterium]